MQSHTIIDMLYEFICQKDILNHYIFWKHISFCKWNENFSVKLYISGHQLQLDLQTSVPSTLLFVT